MEFGGDLIWIGIVVGVIALAYFGTMATNMLKKMFERRGRKGFLYWFLLIFSYLFVYTAIVFFICGGDIATTISCWYSDYSLYLAGPLALFWLIIALQTKNVHHSYD